MIDENAKGTTDREQKISQISQEIADFNTSIASSSEETLQRIATLELAIQNDTITEENQNKKIRNIDAVFYKTHGDLYKNWPPKCLILL